MGRKKIVIRRIENKAARDICFSKRREGLFRKANELAVMCGAEAYSFGHPSAEDIVDRFLRPAEQAGAAGAGMGAAVDPDRLAELQQKYNKLSTELGAVEKRKERWGQAIAKGRGVFPLLFLLLRCIGNPTYWLALFCIHCAELMKIQAWRLIGAGAPAETFGRSNLGCTSANGGMEENFQQQQMMMAMPHLPGLASGYGFELGGTSADRGMYEMIKHQMMMMMMAMPPPPGYAAGTEIIQQKMVSG
ncbi:hypothetical protein VPH35_009949 [Triticum aestivum]